MAQAIELEKYIPGEGKPFSFCPAQIGLTTLEINGKVVPHLQTVDFPVNDPWSLLFRRSIAELRIKRAFKGSLVTELGIGDGRNIKEVGSNVAGVVGIDIERWRIEVASINLGSASEITPLELWKGDAVTYLDKLKRGKSSLSGWAILCLPQSPEGENSADRYDGASNLDTYRSDWDESGLTLNAAVLDHLREVSDLNLRALIILSDRVPEEIKRSFFTRTGWVVENLDRTIVPIQQDPDTGIAWVEKIDDGRRFYEKVDGYFEPISAFEAERRRKESLESGLGREVLNVYHGLTVYQLRGK